MGRFIVLATCVASALIGGVVSNLAANVITPATVTASTAYDANPASNLISNDSLTTSGDVSTWWLDWDYSAGGMWMSTNATVNQQWLSFDLGGQYDLSKAYLWQYAQIDIYGRGAKDLEIWRSNSAGDLVSRLTPANSVGLTEASGKYNYTQPFDLVGATNVEYLKIAIDSNWNNDSTGYVGLGKVRFEGSAVPEPSTLVLLGCVLAGLLAYVWRKRK